MPRQAQRKKGQKKDPNAPKRPPTAFFLFAQTRRQHIKRAAPGASVTHIAKALGEEWRNLREHEKNEFYAQAELEKRKYEKIKERYLANKKANSGPKRSPTAFFLFAKDRRPAIKQAQPEAKVTDVAKILGEEWRNLADNSKLKYQQEAHRLKKIYDQDKAKFEARQNK
eukprot:g5617.t1